MDLKKLLHPKVNETLEWVALGSLWNLHIERFTKFSWMYPQLARSKVGNGSTLSRRLEGYTRYLPEVLYRQHGHDCVISTEQFN